MFVHRLKEALDNGFSRIPGKSFKRLLHSQVIQEGDKVGRRRLYEKLKRPPDFTVQ